MVSPPAGKSAVLRSSVKSVDCPKLARTCSVKETGLLEEFRIFRACDGGVAVNTPNESVARFDGYVRLNCIGCVQLSRADVEHAGLDAIAILVIIRDDRTRCIHKCGLNLRGVPLRVSLFH